MFSDTLGLERYFLRKATWPETLLFLLAAAGLFWPEYWADLAGVLLFGLAVCLQKYHRPMSLA